MRENAETHKLAQSVADFYEEFGAAFSSTRHAPWGVMKLVKDAVKPGDVLVDFGAGNGRLGLEISSDVKFIAVEPSFSLREEAKRILTDRPNTEIFAGGFGVQAPRAAPVLSTSADVIACLAVLHHIPTKTAQRAAIQELAELLKPGGALVLTVWNLRHRVFFRNKTWLAAWLRWPLVKGGEPGDVWIPWKAQGANAQRFNHAFTLHELRSLFDPKIWDIKICQGWGDESQVRILDAKNLVVLARRK